MKWSLLKASQEFGVTRETIRRGLTGLDIDPQRGDFSTREIFKAIAGDLKAERIREVRARADLLERERSEKDRTLVNLSEVQKMLTDSHLPIRQRLMALPSEMAHRTNPTDPTFARAALQQWIDEALPLIRSDLPKPKAGKE